MKNKPSLEYLLSQIAEILDMVKQSDGPLSPSVDLQPINAQLDQLENLVGAFKDKQDELFQNDQMDLATINKEILNSSQTTSTQKQLLLQSQQIEFDTQVYEIAYAKILKKSKKGKKNKQGGVQDQDDAKKQQMRDRRKLFKTIGGDKTWIPL